MLSPSDTILIFVVALLLFGPEHLPKIARQLGEAMRHVQSTTNSFMSEMERAASASDRPSPPAWTHELPAPHDDVSDAELSSHDVADAHATEAPHDSAPHDVISTPPASGPET
jgi:TatA/E family protein of Tat protein translocase